MHDFWTTRPNALVARSWSLKRIIHLNISSLLKLICPWLLGLYSWELKRMLSILVMITRWLLSSAKRLERGGTRMFQFLGSLNHDIWACFIWRANPRPRICHTVLVCIARTRSRRLLLIALLLELSSLNCVVVHSCTSVLLVRCLLMRCVVLDRFNSIGGRVLQRRGVSNCLVTAGSCGLIIFRSLLIATLTERKWVGRFNLFFGRAE